MNKSVQIVVAVVIVAVAVAGYYFWQQRQQPAPTLAVTPPPPPPAAPAAEPQILHPIESPAPPPSVEHSEATMVSALQDMLGKKALALLLTDRMIHRIVATVDALPRRKAPTSVWPVKPVPGSFVTTGSEGDLAIAADNAARYAPYAALARSVDARRLVDLYRSYYGLFQRAYQELGYPKGYFNDRLIEAIDDLLDAPEPAEPVRLVQPKVLYQFADPDLESRSAGQKIMIRMGVKNAKTVKAKLREIRQVLTGGGAR